MNEGECLLMIMDDYQCRLMTNGRGYNTSRLINVTDDGW